MYVDRLKSTYMGPGNERCKLPGALGRIPNRSIYLSSKCDCHALCY